MPPLPDANKILRSAFRYTVEGQENLAIMHFSYDGAGANQVDLDNLTDGLGAAVKALFQNLQHVDAAYSDMNVIDLTSHSALTSDRPVAGNGTHAGGASPANCACVLSWGIHRRYRGGHPRTYLGAIPLTAYATERQFTAAYVALALGNTNAFRAGFPLASGGAYGNIRFGSLSYFTAGAIRPVPVFDEITSSHVNTRPDSQRRRLGKVAG
jgi:hypothetical protein